MLHLFLVVLGYISLCLSGVCFAFSIGLAIFSRSKKGFLIPLVYLAILSLLFIFINLIPSSGSEAWTTVLFYLICICLQFFWIGKVRNQVNKVLKWALFSSLFTSGFLLCAMILMNIALAFQ